MKIEDLKNKNTLNVPEDYFDTLQFKIASKTGNSTTPTKRRKKQFCWRSIGYAASIAIIAFIGEFVYNNSGNRYDITANEEFYDKEYIDNVLTNFPIDDYTFYCYLTNTDINQ